MEDLERIGIPPNSFMPELPEVETIKNVLNTFIQNRRILSIEVLRNSTILGDVNEFVNRLTNETFLYVSRVGKYLIFHLTNNNVFLSHLRMEGKYFEFDENDKNTKHARVIFHLDNNKKLIYDDSRCFGIMKLTSENKYLLEEEISKLGPEPFDIKDVNVVYQKAIKSSLPIKSFLLDQTVMTGLGNIYVDETLFISNLHPLTPAKDISKEKFKEIINNSIIILNKAIKSGGSTIKSYHPGHNIDGNFQTELKVYGKKGEKCPTCGTTFRFTKVGGRGTTYCPICQSEKKDKIILGITGKIAAGKSTVLASINALGIPTISSDEIVRDLYNTKKVAILLNKAFNLTFTTFVDKNILREHLLNNPNELEKLNKIVHPLVKDEINKFISKNKAKIIAVEVPLLFEAKMEDMFDYIIGVDILSDIQLERLNKRNQDTAKNLLAINKNHQFDKNKKKIDFIIINNDSIDNLNTQINDIISKVQECLN